MPHAKILIVEDESIIAVDIQNTLESFGYTVPAIVSSGEAAIKKVEETHPDLILMDIVLKGEMDGVETADLIRSYFDIPVIYLTSYTDIKTLERAKITEPFGYIVKPFEGRELYMAIEVALYNHKMERKLKDSERWLTTTLQSIGDAVIATDVEGLVTFMNPVAESLTGWAQGEAMGKDLVEVFNVTAEERPNFTDDLLSRTSREGVIVDLVSHNMLIARYREPIPISYSASPLKDDKGSVAGMVLSFRDITQQLRAEEVIRHLAYHDALTKLPNLLLFKDRLSLELAHSNRNKHNLAVMFLDIDQFKKINDALGHNMGDQFLKMVAERLRSLMREEDTIARFGGDEFVLLSPGIAHGEEAVKIAQRIMEIFKQPWFLGGQKFHITVSIGIAIYPSDGEDSEALLRNADIAMYRAKEAGRNQYRFYNPKMSEKILERLNLENSLRRALEHEEFTIFYQPRVDGNSGRIVGIEALIRWRHPKLGLVSPKEFIPLAEESGLILPIGEWVLRSACAQNRAWQEAGFPPMRIGVAVNLSSHQFQQRNLAEVIDRILKETGLEAQWLELEITEGSAMNNIKHTIEMLSSLRKIGVQILIDDFGIGYSSLNYLKQLPINGLKIDQSFVKEITTSPADAAIIETIVILAKKLKLKVVAEGVETQEQFAFLKERGCNEVQGFLFSKPLPAEDFEKILRRFTLGLM